MRGILVTKAVDEHTTSEMQRQRIRVSEKSHRNMSHDFLFGRVWIDQFFIGERYSSFEYYFHLAEGARFDGEMVN